MKRLNRTALFRTVLLVLIGLFAVSAAPVKAFSSTEIAQRGVVGVKQAGSLLQDTTYSFVDGVFLGGESLIDVGGNILSALRLTTYAFVDVTMYGLASTLTGVSDIGRASQAVIVETGNDFVSGARMLRYAVAETSEVFQKSPKSMLASAEVSVEPQPFFKGSFNFVKYFYIAFGEESTRASELLFASGIGAFERISDGFETVLDPIRTVHQLTTETGYGFGQSIGEGFLALGTYPEEIWYQSESFVQNNRIIVDTALALQESGRMTRNAFALLAGAFDKPNTPVDREVEIASMQPIVVPPLDIVPDRLVANASTALGSWWGTIVDGVDSAVAVIVNLFSNEETFVVEPSPTLPIPISPTAPTLPTPPSPVVTTFVSSEPQTSITNVYNTAQYLTTTGGGISMTQLALAIIGLRDELEPQIELAMTRPRSNFNNSSGDDDDDVDLSGYLQLAGGTLTGALGGTDGTFSGALSAATLTVVGSTTLNGVEYLFPSSDGSDNYVLTTDSNGALTWEAGAVGGITSLGGLSGASQTFASSSDTNIGITIVSSGTTHTFTPSWIGTLAAGRGGTGTSTVNANELLIGNAGGTAWTTIATSSLGFSFGDVTGPASATDNAIARFDLTTGKIIQNSGITIEDTNRVGLASNVFISGEGNNFQTFSDSGATGYASMRTGDSRFHLYSTTGTVRFALLPSADQFQIGNNAAITWSANATDPGTGIDVGLVRDSAGVLRISDGTTGGGALLANYFTATSTTATSTFAGGLSVAGSGGLNVLQNGKVGVGNAAPIALLSVGSSNAFISLTNSDVSSGSWIRNDGSNTVFSSNNGSMFIGFSGDAGKTIHIGNANPGALQVVGSAPSSSLVVSSSGNVGIGSSTPSTKLVVSGGVTGEYFVGTSTTATSTFVGGVLVGSGSSGGGTERGLVVQGTGANIVTITGAGDASTPVGLRIFNTGGVADQESNIELGGFGLAVKNKIKSILNSGGGSSDLQLTYGNTGTTIGFHLEGSSGFVGLGGVTAPPAMLTLAAGNNDGIMFTNDSNANYRNSIANTNSGSVGADNKMIFKVSDATATGQTTVMTLTGGGNVGIGSSTPSTKLVVSGGVTGEYFVGTSTTATSTFAGAVGIGTASPAQKLDVVGNIQNSGGSFISTSGEIKLLDSTTATVFRGVRSSAWVDNADTRFFQIGAAGDNVVFQAQGGSAATRMLFNASSTQITAGAYNSLTAPTNLFEIYDSSNASKFTLTTGGSLGIGTTTPFAKLTVTGTVAFDGLSTGSGDAVCIDPVTKEIQYNSGADTCLASSLRFKHDIEDLSLDLSDLRELRAVSYKENATGEERIGFIAEEVEDVDERLMFYEPNGHTPRGVRYEDIVALVVKSIQEIADRLDKIEDQLASAGQGVGNFINLIVEKITADEVQTEKLCIGETCLTENQLIELLDGTNVEEPPVEEEEEEDPPTDDQINEEEGGEEEPPADESEDEPEEPVDEPADVPEEGSPEEGL